MVWPRCKIACPHCKEEYYSDEVEVDDIKEDVEGRDVVTFNCILCRCTVQSLVVGD